MMAYALILIILIKMSAPEWMCALAILGIIGKFLSASKLDKKFENWAEKKTKELNERIEEIEKL